MNLTRQSLKLSRAVVNSLMALRPSDIAALQKDYAELRGTGI